MQVIALIITIWIFSPCPVGASPYLPVNHRVYDFLERMETLGIIPLSRLGMRPTTRTYAAGLLAEVYKKRERLSRVDREELKYILEEFRHDLPPNFRLESPADHGPLPRLPKFLYFLYHNRQNLYSSVSEDYTLFLDPVIVRSTTRRDSSNNPEENEVNIAGNGFILRGTVGEHVGYFVDVRDSYEWGSRKYNGGWKPPGIGWYAQKGDHAEFDETHAHLTYQNGPFLISWGRGENVWGRGKSGTLALSDYSPPYDQLRFEVSFWRLRFNYLLGEIKQYPQILKIRYENPVSSNQFVASQKYIAAHRVEIDFLKNLSVGLYEVVIFGDRFEFSYANPVNFLRGAEHYNRDHDNAALGADFRFIRSGVSVYGDFFIDDIMTKKIGTDWYGNKFGMQFGLYSVEPFGLDGFDTRVEYTRIDPWVYTHKYPINTYTHYGDGLGYFSGPNSDVFFVEIRKRFTRRLETGFVFTRKRHGANFPDRNIGGDILQGGAPEGTTSSRFLDGIITETTSAGLGLSFEIARNLFFKGEYALENNGGERINVFTISFALNGVE
jgi:hypothetical protein